ncbi:aspartic peptidase A1 [Trametes sanguinea]|nr:aspartic peptidase A1 [Trametes sanguinea]
MAKRFNLTGTKTLLSHDQARARSLRARATSTKVGTDFVEDANGNVPVDNQVVSYVASVGVGNPPTTYSLIVDTGSSNTWVGAGTPYVATSSSSRTRDSVSVTYGSGSFSGYEYLDTVTLGSDLTIVNQSIGVADTSDGFDGVDGILGIGPTGLTLGTLSPDALAEIPTVTDSLASQGDISSDSIGISFEPTDSPEVVNGELTFGGTDPHKFTGSITYTPVTSIPPASQYFGIAQGIRYGSPTGTAILSSTVGIVDTGTTLTLIASDAFNKYRRATGAVEDDTTGLLRLTQAQFKNLKSLFFHIGGIDYELTPNAQIWPRALNTAIGGDANTVYLIVGDVGTPSGSGLDFIDGLTFLERFYAVFDSTNHRVGFATTPFTDATTN